MNWAYLTGFFDGDGCLSIVPGESYQLRWYQHPNWNSEVFRQIRVFLWKNQIEAKPYKPNTLIITKKRGIEKCLGEMHPYLIVKYEVASNFLGLDSSWYSDMSWAYIAGFFDAEGCMDIRLKKGRSVPSIRMQLTQAVFQSQVLDEIKLFLTDYGLTVCDYVRKDGRDLVIHKRSHIEFIAKKLEKHLIIKKERIRYAVEEI